MSQYFDSFFSTGGFIYYRESNIPNFWDRFNVLEHGSTDSLTSVFKPGAYLGKKKVLIIILLLLNTNFRGFRC